MSFILNYLIIGTIMLSWQDNMPKNFLLSLQTVAFFDSGEYIFWQRDGLYSPLHRQFYFYISSVCIHCLLTAKYINIVTKYSVLHENTKILFQLTKESLYSIRFMSKQFSEVA